MAIAACDVDTSSNTHSFLEYGNKYWSAFKNMIKCKMLIERKKESSGRSEGVEVDGEGTINY